ncbi:MFS transporter [Allostreptomyces psammosilenae]|uniref:Putative MFS family arabinose efflux permease n=1 Tax=Allostreptomyces psammosilenae TaxID=1892865 RepID=A0A852ZYG0_9ACTN|nr:MFS transporter [Allostreptomyces psammosilenae]NYI07376.1 putative MFS family arabinose efflux permease [Allostreptomyces psammosilenae]
MASDTAAPAPVSGVPSAVPSVTGHPRRHRPGLTLAAVLLGYLTLPMSMSGTTVALPGIGADLGASGAPLQWVVTGYFLTASCFMLVAGSLGDLFGRRRIFRIGATVYTAGTLAGAAARDVLLLDVARTLTGAGAAGVMAGGGAILATTFTGAARTRAFATVGTVAGVGLALGPTLSGALVGLLGWRPTFLLFAAAGALVLAGTAVIAESRADAERRPRVDVAGVVTFVAGLALAMFGITQVAGAGWGSPRVLAPLAAGVLLLAAFPLVERRAEHPVLDLALLRDRPFLGWCLAILTMAVGSAGVLIFLPTYLQGAGGLTAGEAGLVMLMMTSPVLFVPPLGGRLINRGVSPRLLVVAALLLLAAGNAWLLVLHPGAGAGTLFGPLVTIGVSQGLVIGIIDAQALNRVEPERIGMASGFLNTVKGGSNALVLALFGAVMVSLLRARVGSAEVAARVAAGDLAGSRRDFLAEQFTGAWHVLGGTVAACCLVSALFVGHLVGRSPERP